MHIASDGYLRITGEIRLKSGDAPEGCLIRLYTQPKGKLLEESEIEPIFKAGFVVAPWKEKYTLGITCRGVAEPFRSQTFKAPGKIELGTIILDDSKSK